MIVSRDLKILPSECPRWSARRFAKDDMPRNEPTKQKPRTNSYHFYHALNLGFVTEKWFQGANIIRTGRYSYSFHYYSNLPLLLPAPLSCLFSLKFEKTPKKLPDSFLLISIFFPPYLVHSSWQTFPTSRRWIILFQTVRFIIMDFLLRLLVLLFFPSSGILLSPHDVVDLWLWCILLFFDFPLILILLPRTGFQRRQLLPTNFLSNFYLLTSLFSTLAFRW